MPPLKAATDPGWVSTLMIELITNNVLLLFLAIVAVAVVRVRQLLVSVMLFGIYSLLSAAIFVVMLAADVAFTEAAVGAGIATVLMLAALARLPGEKEEARARGQFWPLVLVVATGALLIYGTIDMPGFGKADNVAHRGVAMQYVERAPKETGIPNMVTSILASYRGLDTLGEVLVIFTAGLGVLLVLGGVHTKIASPLRPDAVGIRDGERRG